MPRKRCSNSLNLPAHNTATWEINAFFVEKHRDSFPQLAVGQRICTSCQFHVLKRNESANVANQDMEDVEVTEARTTAHDATFDEDNIQQHQSLTRVNSMLKLFSLSPITKTSKRAQDAPAMKRKYDKVSSNVQQDFSTVGSNLLSLGGKRVSSCVTCVKLIDALHTAFQAGSLTRKEKYQILTCIPEGMSIPCVTEKFQCTQYMAREASKLRKERGAFSAPEPKLGRPISHEITRKIVDFYLDPGNSRIQPDKTIFIGVGTGKTRAAKQLMAVTLDELFTSFRETNPDVKISLSKFSTLKPKQCAWAGSRGFHRQCVCEIHQNYHLLLDACGKSEKTIDSLRGIFCDLNDSTCMLARCSTCPNLDLVHSWCNGMHLELDEEIEFWQWTKNNLGYSELAPKSLEVPEFLQELKKAIPKVAAHHFIMVKQREYISGLRESLLQHEAVLYVDFAENYSIVVQDEVQGFHWTNNQVTVHPCVLEWRSISEGTIKSKSIVVISDELQHDASSFHVFRAEAIQIIKGLIPGLKLLHYISDGAGSQYKNFKNFANLLHHEYDFHLKATWTFTATAHGKSRCDGVGAVVKNTARRAALRNTKIMTAQDLYLFCDEKLGACMEFIYVDKVTVANRTSEFKLNERYANSATVKGTRKYHFVQPHSSQDVLVKEFASGTESKIHKVITLAQSDYEYPIAGEFIACRIGKNVEIGMVLEVDADLGDIMVTFMKKLRINQFRWHDPPKEEFIPLDDFLCKVGRPITATGRLYKLAHSDAKNIEQFTNE